MHALFLTALLIGDNPYRVVEANPFTVQVSPAKTDGFYVQWADGSYAYPGSPVLDRPQTSTVYVVGPWHNSREAIYATLSSPTRQQIEAALAQARQEWASAQRTVSRSAIPFAWPLPSAGETVDPDLTRNGPLPKGFDLGDMVRYKRAEFTQAMSRLGGYGRPNPRDPFDRANWHIEAVSRAKIDAKWRVSGGMEGIEGFRSDLYKNAVEPIDRMELLPVTNSSGFIQHEQGHKRAWPDGAKFLDVLSAGGNVFEVRKREKIKGRWKSFVMFEDEKARPIGYKSITFSCNDCHSRAGEASYGLGAIPGADGVISFPFKALEQP